MVAVHAQETMVRSVAVASHAVVFPDVALHNAGGADWVPPVGATVALVACVAGHARRTVVRRVARTSGAVTELNVAVHDAGAEAIIGVSNVTAQAVDSSVSSCALGAGSRGRASADAVVAVRHAEVAVGVIARLALA